MTIEKTTLDQIASYPYPALPGPGSMGVISARNFGAPLLCRSGCKISAFFWIIAITSFLFLYLSLLVNWIFIHLQKKQNGILVNLILDCNRNCSHNLRFNGWSPWIISFCDCVFVFFTNQNAGQCGQKNRKITTLLHQNSCACPHGNIFYNGFDIFAVSVFLFEQ